jgi:FtsZ-binding cell division protein ZapB
MAEAKKTATKATRKPAAKRKPVAKSKPVAKRKPVATKKPAAKRATAKKSTPDFVANAQETGRNVFLASLGFYGKAYDQAQEQFGSLQKELKARRKKADKAYMELVTRGAKLEKVAKVAIDDIDLPKLELDNLTDRKALQTQLKKAKARFEELKGSVRFKSAA